MLIPTSSMAAFCSLRDPISAIQTLYESDFQFKSVVTTITDQDRSMVKNRLPFTIHQSEVNKHTLYLIFKDEAHHGFLQARSEWAKWGLIEIAWAINIDKSIRGFYYQRCRSPLCNDNVVKSINDAIKEKSFLQLKSFLSQDGKSLSEVGKTAFPTAQDIALLTLHSALKTLAITDISWSKQIKMAAIR